MAILGIGNDIVEIERIQNTLDLHPTKFLEKVLTPSEILEYKKRKENISYLAGRFSAKEAIVKALGTGIGKIGFHDMEILANQEGKPIVSFSPSLQKTIGKTKMHLSISHSKEHATAIAVWED